VRERLLLVLACARTMVPQQKLSSLTRLHGGLLLARTAPVSLTRTPAARRRRSVTSARKKKTVVVSGAPSLLHAHLLPVHLRTQDDSMRVS
jgi:hypothetical protein